MRNEGKYRRNKQGVSEDLVPLACSCARPRQSDDLVPGVCHSHKSTGQPCLQKDAVEFSLWDWCAFQYGNNGVAGANCLHSRSSCFCFDGETW